MKDGPMGGAIFLIAALDGESNNDASPNTCGAFDLLQENPYQEEREQHLCVSSSEAKRVVHHVLSTDKRAHRRCTRF